MARAQVEAASADAASADEPGNQETDPIQDKNRPLESEEERHESNMQETTHPKSATMDYPKFWVATLVAGVAVILLFVGNLSYLYGSMYQQTARSKGIRILMVDFDNHGLITQAMLGAYQRLAGPNFPTCIVRNSPEPGFQSADDIFRLVREEKYWAAIYVQPGASQRLSAAIAGNSSEYSPNKAMAYVWNQIRYPAVSGGIIMPALVQLTSATQTAYQMANAQRDFQVLSTIKDQQGSPSRIALQAFLNPIGATPVNIREAAHATKGLYNTVSLAVPIVQQFFFIVAFNGISDQFGLFHRPAKISGAIRFVVGALFACGSALGTTGYIWAFRETWEVPGKVFGETWMLLWFMMHIYYLVWDTATAFLPIAIMPFIIVTFLFLSITSANSPFEVTPGFYRWSQSLPAFETLQMLWNVWSGSFTKVYQALPVLFSWWVVWMVLATFGFVRRRRLAAEGIALSK